jgi:hypothetical protein
MTDERGSAELPGTRDARWDDDRGDVPGWVLITLMTAGLTTPSTIEGWAPTLTSSSRRAGDPACYSLLSAFMPIE